jgi:D-amino peptidase
LDHTWSGKITNVWLNDTLVGEYGLNAALAGYFGLPAMLITGDQTACSQATELLGPLETVVVKRATGRFSAECLPPSVSQAAIREGAKRAMQRLKKGDVVEPFIVDTPVQVTVEFISSEMADRAERVPGASREGTRVAAPATDMREAYITFRAMAGLAAG